MGNIILNGNQAIGHTDKIGGSVIGTVQATGKIKIGGVSVALQGDYVSFPSHGHALNKYGALISFRSHMIPLNGNSKLYVGGKKASTHGEIVNVADEAGGNATLQSTTNKLTST